MNALYHIADKQDWLRAQEAGTYTTSTRGKSLEEVGYIHLSFAHQVKMVADALYRGAPDLVLLVIDPGRLTSTVVIEPVPGTDDAFPHLYGPLDVRAVVGVIDYAPQTNGEFPAIAGI